MGCSAPRRLSLIRHISDGMKLSFLTGCELLDNGSFYGNFFNNFAMALFSRSWLFCWFELGLVPYISTVASDSSHRFSAVVK